MAYNVIHSQLICARYDEDYPRLVSGRGARVFDEHGRSFIDGSGCTAAVTAIGHGVTEIADAIADQARTLAVHPTHVFHSDVLEAYLARLCAFAPDGFDRAWTISGGTEAIENACKLAFQYHRAQGRTRSKIIGRWGSYHGNSLLALDVGGMKARRDFYTPLMVGHLHVSPCFAYRRPAGQSLEAYEDGLVEEFAATLEAHHDDVVAFVAEPIVGAALGAVPPTERYFARIAEHCRAHDVVMIADEVMTGMGRTGRPFGCEHYGTHADILACAKGITGGYLPMGAIIAHDRVIDPIMASGDPFWSGQTYSCIPLAAAAGGAVLDYIEQHGLVARAADVGARLGAALRGLMDDLDVVGDVRGCGMFWGVEYVADRSTDAPFDPAVNFAKRVEAAALERGLVTYAGRGTVEQRCGDHMLFAPPLVIEEAELDELVAILRESIVAVRAEL